MPMWPRKHKSGSLETEARDCGCIWNMKCVGGSGVLGASFADVADISYEFFKGSGQRSFVPLDCHSCRDRRKIKDVTTCHRITYIVVSASTSSPHSMSRNNLDFFNRLWIRLPPDQLVKKSMAFVFQSNSTTIRKSEKLMF